MWHLEHAETVHTQRREAYAAARRKLIILARHKDPDALDRWIKKHSKRLVAGTAKTA